MENVLTGAVAFCGLFLEDTIVWSRDCIVLFQVFQIGKPVEEIHNVKKNKTELLNLAIL